MLAHNLARSFKYVERLIVFCAVLVWLLAILLDSVLFASWATLAAMVKLRFDYTPYSVTFIAAIIQDWIYFCIAWRKKRSSKTDQFLFIPKKLFMSSAFSNYSLSFVHSQFLLLANSILKKWRNQTPTNIWCTALFFSQCPFASKMCKQKFIWIGRCGMNGDFMCCFSSCAVPVAARFSPLVLLHIHIAAGHLHRTNKAPCLCWLIFPLYSIFITSFGLTQKKYGCALTRTFTTIKLTAEN